MSKTVDDLIMVFEKARAEAAPFPQHHEDGLYAGIAAVVRAVRDEIVEDGNCKYCVATTAMYNEILGDAGEKVAEYTGGMNDLSVTPATDPAPAVCEWKQLGDRHGHFTRECSKYPTTSAAGDYCSNCGKPIKFTEAKT